MLVDIKKLKIHFDGDEELIDELIIIFSSSYKETLSALNLALESKCFKSIELHAHTLKGMVSNFFADEIKEHALNIEREGREQNLVGAMRELELIRIKIPLMIKEIKSAEI